MMKRELEEMTGTVVEQKLLELLGDPEEGLSVHQSLRKRLLRQRQAVAKGSRGLPLDAVARKAGGCRGLRPETREWYVIRTLRLSDTRVPLSPRQRC